MIITHVLLHALLRASAVLVAVTVTVAAVVAVAEAVVLPAVVAAGSVTTVARRSRRRCHCNSCDGCCCRWPSTVVAHVVVEVSPAAICLTAAGLTAVEPALAAPRALNPPAAGTPSTPGDSLSFPGNCISSAAL